MAAAATKGPVRDQAWEPPALLAGAWLEWVATGIAVLSVWAVVRTTLRSAGLDGTLLAVALAVWALGVCLIGVHALAARLPAWRPAMEACLSTQPLWLIVALGLLLRIAWMVAFPAAPGSDGAVYVGLAQRLAAGEGYEVVGTRAYWPPGYPLTLAATQALLGSAELGWRVVNLAAFVATALGSAALAGRLGGAAAGRAAALLVAVWPNLIASAGAPEKELLVCALLPWAFVRLLAVLDARGGWVSATVCGLALGAAVLVQPSLQLLLPALALLLIWRAGRRGVGLVLGLLLGAALVVGPWSARNYAVFGEFVLVSTNGGSNLYRANNPLATGGYTARGAVDLSGLAELDQDRVGRELAWAWMRDQPAAALALSVEKLTRFLGDDARGVYATLRVGRSDTSAALYLALKGVANLWWLVAWLVLAAALRPATRSAAGPWGWRLVLWPWLYLMLLHSVFESAGKYHVPVLWVLAVAIACVLCGPERKRRC